MSDTRHHQIDIDEMFRQRDEYRDALKAVVADVLEYERVNNIAPNPGRKFCWDSVAHAHNILTQSNCK